MSRYSEVLESIFTSENKYTVLQLLKALISAVEEMAGHTVTNIDLEQSGATTGQPVDVTLRFTFDDNTTNQFILTIPAGARGYSITNAKITDDNHLVVTFGDGSTKDAGTIKGSKLYRHNITITTSSGSSKAYFRFTVIDGNESYDGDDETLWRNYRDTASSDYSQRFIGAGNMYEQGSSAVTIINSCRFSFDDSTNIVTFYGITSSNSSYSTTSYTIEDDAYPLSLVAKGDKGDKGDKGKYIEVTAINAAGDVTEAGQRYSMVFTEKDPANPSYSNTYSKEFLVPRGPQGAQGVQGYQGISVNAIDITDDGITDQGHQHTLEMEFTDPAYGTHFTQDAEFYTTDRRVVKTGTVTLNSDGYYHIETPSLVNIFYPIIIRVVYQNKYELWYASYHTEDGQRVQKVVGNLDLGLYGARFGRYLDNEDYNHNYIDFDPPTSESTPPSSMSYTIEYEQYVPYLLGASIDV